MPFGQSSIPSSQQQHSRLSEASYHEVTDSSDDDDIVQGWGPHVEFLNNYDRYRTSYGSISSKASSTTEHDTPDNLFIRFLNRTRAKLNKLWSPDLELQEVTWIPKQFWEVPPRLVGGDGILDDIRHGVPPQAAYIKVNPWTLDSQALREYRHTREQAAFELKRRHRRTRRRKLVAMAIGALLFFTALGSLAYTG
jgi:hypothetical protein